MKLTRTVWVRLAGLIVVAICVMLPVGGALAHAAGPSEQPSLDWSMPDRYGDANQDGFGDQVYPPDGQAQIDPGRWRVDLTVSGADCGGSTQRTWWIEGTQVVPSDPHLLAGSAGGCSLSYGFPTEGVYEVAFEERDQQGNLLGLVKRAITVQDFLIVSIGDSVASGEGNPEVPGASSASWENGSAAAAQRHRSRYAGPSQAALTLERADPHTSVTFVHLACSGATTLNGLLGPELAGQGPVTVQQPPQLDQLKQLVGSREIDALFLSVGANDVHFSTIVQKCLLMHDCNHLYPGSAAQDFARDSAKLPGYYDQLASALDSLGIPAGRVYLSEYFDPTHDAAAAICNNTILADSPVQHVPGQFLSVTGTEAQWASATLVGGINQLGAAAAAQFGWNRVGGITSQFLTHGYCAADHWVDTYTESLALQGDTNGTIHPNHSGQAVYRDRLRASASNDLLPSSTARRPFQRLVLKGQGPNDAGFGDTVGNVEPGATGELRVQLNGKDVAGKSLSYSLRGQGGLSTTSGTTDSSGQASFSYRAPTLPTGCSDGPVCGGITAAFTDQDGLHTDALTVGVDEAVEVTVSPGTVTLVPGRQATFAATVEGTSDQSVAWTATGGTITTAGVYTAGNTPGTYTVTATSNTDPSKSASASVSVVSASTLSGQLSFTDHSAPTGGAVSDISEQASIVAEYTNGTLTIDSATGAFAETIAFPADACGPSEEDVGTVIGANVLGGLSINPDLQLVVIETQTFNFLGADGLCQFDSSTFTTTAPVEFFGKETFTPGNPVPIVIDFNRTFVASDGSETATWTGRLTP